MLCLRLCLANFRPDLSLMDVETVAQPLQPRGFRGILQPEAMRVALCR